MNGAVLVVILAAAVTGGGAAYLIWALVLPLFSAPPSPATAAPEPALPDPSVAQPPPPAPPPEVPQFPDPSLSAQVAAVRTDMAAIARAQIAMLEGMAERENQLLNEMRAVASVRDPELIKSLQRIEARLSGKPLPKTATVLEEGAEAPSPRPPPIDAPAAPPAEPDIEGVAQGEDDNDLLIGRA